jgi:hypothetical protein
MINPGFFTDEDIAGLTPTCRLLFIGLWTIADRKGRLEDRPARIKVQLAPYDDADVDALLHELVAARFIVRYASEGRKLIQIRTFERHQHPHVKEPASVLPGPDQASPVQASGEPGAGPVLALVEHQSSPSESESESESESRHPFGSVQEHHESLDAVVSSLTEATSLRRLAR